MEQQAEHTRHYAMTLTGLQNNSKREKQGRGVNNEHTMTMEQQAEHTRHHAMTLAGLQNNSKRVKQGRGSTP